MPEDEKSIKKYSGPWDDPWDDLNEMMPTGTRVDFLYATSAYKSTNTNKKDEVEE